MNEPFRSLVEAAILAPSGDNTQPWTFEVDEKASTISVLLDETRDPSPMNAHQRMARIACGAAIENVVQTASYNGLHASVELLDHPCRLAKISVLGENPRQLGIPDHLIARHTNRKRYSGYELTADDRSAFDGMAPEGDVEITWLTQRSALRTAAEAIGRADARMFGQSVFLRAFLHNVRYDAAASDGLPTGSLELSALEQRVLPLLAHVPDAALRWLFAPSFRSKARALVQSASGLCLFTTRTGRWPHDIQLGRSFERAWLHLTKCGFQCQPMMSIPVLENAGAEALGAKSWRTAPFAEICERTPWAILRFGRADRATARAGRWPLETVCRTLADKPTHAACRS